MSRAARSPRARSKRYYLAMVAVHAALAACAYALSYGLRFDFNPGSAEVRRMLVSLPLLVAIRLGAYAAFDLFGRVWRYVSVQDMVAIVAATAAGSVAFAAAAFALTLQVPRSIIVIEWIIGTGFVAGARLVTRAIAEWNGHNGSHSEGARRAIVVGAGDAGELLLREMGRAVLGYEAVAIVDDDPRLEGRRLHGVSVRGGVDDLPRLSRELHVDEILIAVPSADAAARHRILARGRECGVPLKTVLAVSEMLGGRARVGGLQDVRPEDVIGRAPVAIDEGRLRAAYAGRRILITGAAGSIGSELCRQVAMLGPERIVLYERAESALFFVDHELRKRFPHLRIEPVIGDILDREKVYEVVEMHQPEVVFHAAAYKHVHLMEREPIQAIRNNVLGTEVILEAARVVGASRFVLISTDKAVRAVGIMGMTKRVAEELLVANSGGTTVPVSVRFGNVLGSAGSVLPLFARQIAEGGPVTITDPAASRYFMLVSEAAQLVMEAGAIGQAGDVFFLDMGSPLRIGDLANDMIRMAGLRPQRDVGLQVVGLRPGERLQEELRTSSEELEPTEHERVWKVRQCPFDTRRFLEDLETLRASVDKRDATEAVRRLREMARPG